MITFIEGFESERTVQVDGHTYPAFALAEDDDGLRLLVHSGPIPIRAWVRAAESGAAYLIEPLPDGTYAAVLATDFASNRDESDLLRTLTPRDQRIFSTLPTYRDLLTKPEVVRAKGFVHLHTHSEYCLAPDTLVVTADLVWKAILDVEVGEELVGFDEDLRPPEGERGNSRSKMRRTTVTAKSVVVRDCYRITLEDGTKIVSSGQHGWVANGTSRGSLEYPGGPRTPGYGSNTRRWLTTEQLVPGKSRLVLWAKPWDERPVDERAAGWLSGVFDGEGWLHDGQLGIAQNDGAVQDEIRRVTDLLGYSLTAWNEQKPGSACKTTRLAGYEVGLRFLAQCRPVRFWSRRDEVWVGRRAGGRYSRPVLVTQVEHLGEMETVALQTSTKTFVAEGFLSHNSALDGLSNMAEIVREVAKDNQHAVAITDHGTCAGHANLMTVATKEGIKPIFGIEAYFVHDRLTRPEKGDREAQRSLKDYYHLILWARDDVGLRNLWAMSTESYRDGLYYKPRMDWDTLSGHSEGVMASTACLRGPLLHQALLEDRDDVARQNLARLLGIFGDNLFVEIHTNQLPEQIEANRRLVTLASEVGVPIVAAVDSHYPCADDVRAHRTWLSVQTDSDISDDSDLFAGGQEYHIATEAEVRQALAYLGTSVVDEAVSNTVAIADQCSARIQGTTHMPVLAKSGGAQADVDRLLEVCRANWHLVQNKPIPESVYQERFDREFDLLRRKNYCGYFLLVSDITNHARKNGILVGPGRGSGAGSLIAYLMGITALDPVARGLLFERFLTEGRTSPPDFDVDFPQSKKHILQQYVRDTYGEDHVAVVGSVLRLKSKGVVENLARAMKSLLPPEAYMDLRGFSQIVTDAEADTAGLGMKWDDLWETYGEQLQPYRDKYPDLFAMADKLVGRVKTYGQHAAGLVVSTDEPLTDRLPLRKAGEAGHMVAQFDKDALEALGFLKLDLLTLRNLDTIQEAIDLIRQRRGIEIDVYSWEDQYDDPQVWEEVASGRTLGIFQIETQAGTTLVRTMQPRSIEELADAITLVRPGPKNSGLTASYLRRRAGDEQVTYPDPRLESALGETFGNMIYQEQIMAACMLLAGYTSEQADEIRSILGKKKVDKAKAAGQEFVSRAVEWGGMDRGSAEQLWAQMAEFAKYCVAGDTRVHLASANAGMDGTVTVEELHRRITAPLLPPVSGKPKRGEEYAGPCVVCGATEAVSWTRGACNPCYVWRQKFQDVERGLYGLTVEADGRIRPCRILMVHKHDPAQTWTVTLADGRSITATANHQHLTDQGLRRVDELVVGDRLVADVGYEEHRYARGEYRSTVGDRLLVGAVNGAMGSDNYGYVDGGFASLMAWTAQAPDCCEECGHDGSVNRLERAHLDGVRSNNDWANLRMLCVSCHKKHDYRHNGRRRRWGKGRLTAGVEIIGIEPRAVEPVYSVVMDDPHIWIGNGIATANSFNKSHAYAYATLGYWCAWLKFHFPAEFLCAALSTVDKDRVPDFVKESVRMGLTVLPPDVNESGHGFSVVDNLTIRYGLDAIKGVGDAAVQAVVQGQPYDSLDDFLARKGSACHSGVVALLARVGALDSLYPNRRALEQRFADDKSGVHLRCVHLRSDHVGPNGLPCVFDWANEPPPINPRTGKKTKPKPIPKRCTKACRNYTPPAEVDYSTIEPYSDDDIRDIEVEMLGTYLTSTPFDRIAPEHREDLREYARELDIGPHGRYLVASIITRTKPYKDRSGKPMGFLDFVTEEGEFSAVCFSKIWKEQHKTFQTGALCLVEVEKTSRGFTIQTIDIL